MNVEYVITSMEVQTYYNKQKTTFSLSRIKERDTKRYESGWKMKISANERFNPNPWIVSKAIYQIFEDDDQETPVRYIEYEYKKDGKKKIISFNSQLKCNEIYEKLLRKGYR